MDLDEIQRRLKRIINLNVRAMMWLQTPRNEQTYQLCNKAVMELQEVLCLFPNTDDRKFQEEPKKEKEVSQ